MAQSAYIACVTDHTIKQEAYSTGLPSVLMTSICSQSSLELNVINCIFGFVSDDKGYFYPALKADISKYIKPTSQKLKEWLKKLRKDGKKVFLITNSQADFSMFALENAFGYEKSKSHI